MVDVPVAAPVRVPLVVCMVAFAVLLLLHVPADTVLASTVVVPTHAYGLPVITAGNAFELKAVVTKHEGVVW
jgi:hypothetical protein